MVTDTSTAGADRRPGGMSLAWRFLIAFSVAMWAILSVYFFYDIRTSARRFGDMERSTLEAMFPVVRRLLEAAMLTTGSEHILGILSRPGWQDGLSTISLLDRTKQVVEPADIAGKRPARRSAPPFLNPKMFLAMDFEMRAKASCLRCHRGAGEGDVLGYVRLAIPHFQKGAVIAEHLRNHLLVLTLMLVLTGVVCSVVVRWLVQRPLDRVVAAMEDVAAGRLDTRVAGLPGGEVGAIASGFNEMVAKLERDRGEIVDLHRSQVAHMERLVALGDLAAHLAHEVRNPLTGIGSAVQVMQRETPQDSPRQKVLGQILAQLQRMDRTMASFLQYARMPEASVRSFALADPVQRVLFLLEPKLKAQRIELRQAMAPGLPALRGDPSQLEEVFLNLGLNAVHAMPSGGVLTIEAAPDPSGIVATVRDTGCGMDPGSLKRAFQPYFTTKEKGSGMGLPICRQIVLAHGGDIRLESRPGEGTAVFVRLPAPGVSGAGVPPPLTAGSGLPAPGVSGAGVPPPPDDAVPPGGGI